MFRLDLLAVAAGILSAVFSGCGRQAAKPAPPAPPVVTVASVEQSEITEWEEFTDRTEAVEAAEVRPPIDDRRHEDRGSIRRGE
jgi:membrane fusion protein, multidrug efflux system